jgi:DNA polymerase-3 subunit delta'
MQFKNIIGQQHIKEQLVHMVQHNRLSHALLFLGKEGSGALPLAMAFANYICLQTQSKKTAAPESLFGEEENVPATGILPTTLETIDEWMQSNPSFSKVKEMVHPDIHFSYPVISKKTGDKPISTDFIKEWREFITLHPYGNVFDWLQFINAENKQGNITAHECTDILKKLNLKSFESEYKILLMWMPESLGKEGNKLLKLIEEPPPNTLFLLVAENEDLILPTILSRTQLVKINALNTEEITTALQERAGVQAAKASQVAALCEGNYREALLLLQHAEDDWQSLLREWLNSIAKKNITAQIKWVEETSKMGREKQKQFLKYFIHLLELSVKINAMQGTASVNATGTEIDFAIRLNKLCRPGQYEAIVTELDNASYYIERNANAKMLFHALTIKLSYIINNNSLILLH